MGRNENVRSFAAAVAALLAAGALATTTGPATAADQPAPPTGGPETSLRADAATILGPTPDPSGDRIVTATRTSDGHLDIRTVDTSSPAGAADQIRRAQKTPGAVAVAVDRTVTVDEPTTGVTVDKPTGQPALDAAQAASAASGGKPAAVAATADAAATCTENYTGAQYNGGLANWTYGRDATGVTVAVIDTGVDAAHVDLAGRVSGGHDFVDGVSDGTRDGHGHGTHVAGIIAAKVEPVGSCGISGMVNTTVMPVRVLDDKGVGYTSDIYAGLVWAAEHGADVANLSLGTTEYSAVGQAAVDYVRSLGVAVVAAAGNYGQFGSPTVFPAAYLGVTAVGAVTWDGLAPAWTNTGPYLDVAAHGSGIISTLPGNKWGYMSGTSQAAPHISGMVAFTYKYRRATIPGYTPDEAGRWVVGAGSYLYCNAANHPGGWEAHAGYGIAIGSRLAGVLDYPPHTEPSYGDPCADSLYHRPYPPADLYDEIPPLPIAPVVDMPTIAGSRAISVSWSEPYYFGTTDLIDYTATATPWSSPWGEPPKDKGGPKTCTVEARLHSCTVQGLVNGSYYRLTVAARNSAGTGPAAGHVHNPQKPTDYFALQLVGPVASPPTAPAAGASGDGYDIRASWGYPSDDGGSGVRSYTAVATAADGTTGTCTVHYSFHSCLITGLPRVKKTYAVTTQAANGYGPGPLSAPVNLTVDGTRQGPGPIRDIVATPADGAVTFTWTRPLINGDDEIWDYTFAEDGGPATCSQNDRWPVGTPFSCTVTGLNNGGKYTFTAIAKSNRGFGTSPPVTVDVVPNGPPAAPAQPTAQPGDTTLTIGWAENFYPHGHTIDAYTATATPGGRTCTAGPGATSCTITGLTNATTYQVAITAHTPTGGTSTTPATTSGTPAGGAVFVPITPVRAYDSRLAGGALPAGANRVVSVADGRNVTTGAVTTVDAVPAGAVAVAYNIVATRPGAPGWLAVTPGDAATFSASSVNWTATGGSTSNGLVGALDTNRSLKVFNGSTAATDVVVDVTGYFIQPPPTGAGARFHPITPTRVYDSRRSGGAVPAGPAGRTVDISRGFDYRTGADLGTAVPEGATGIAYNITATASPGSGWLAVTPTGVDTPAASTVNWTGGASTAHGQFVKLEGNRSVTLFNGSGAGVHAIIDIVGYFTEGDTSGGNLFHALTPARAYDSRSPAPDNQSPLASQSVRTVSTANSRSAATGSIIVTDLIPADAAAIAYNLTVTRPTAPGWLATSQKGAGAATASTLNWPAGTSSLANGSVVQVTDRAIDVRNGSSGTAGVLVDVYGYFAPH